MFEKCITWLKDFANNLSDLLVSFLITVASYTVLLYFFRMLWSLYLETQVCQVFRSSNELLFNEINAIMNRNLLFFSFTISRTVLQICLVIALISHFLFIKRWFYDSRGIITRTMLFGIPSAAVIALCMQTAHINLAFTFCLLPTLAMLGACFKFVACSIPWVDNLL
jgi:hypothetical protein